MVAIALMTVATIGCFDIDSDVTEPWTWTLLGDSDNEVTFTQEQLSCLSDTNVLTVFGSIEGKFTWIFEDETWKNYHYGEGGNTLQTIKPDTVYYVSATVDCTLTIERC